MLNPQDVPDDEFEKLISEAMDKLPQAYIERLNNVVVVYADEPTLEQRQRLELRGGQTLFGLYEGIPRTARGAGYNMVLPDKITIFKLPMLASVATIDQLKKRILHTLWHEIAHHYGLDHDRIRELEDE